MSLVLKANMSALRPFNQTYFAAQGGTAPYTYSVQSNGAGGTINPSTGLYTAPGSVNTDPRKSFDTVVVTDAASATATLPILVTDPLGLVCDIIQKYMGLANGRVYIFNQKINEPEDSGIFIAVGIADCQPFGNTVSLKTETGMQALQSVNMQAMLDINVISRSTEALYRKEEIILALNSIYSQQQQEVNGFYVSPISSRFRNLAEVDGAAIPYRFNMSVAIQYAYTKAKEVPYFDEFQLDEIEDEP